MIKDLINRITYHLSSGGLFNPELADHLAVRNLLMECRDALAQRTWVGLTDEEWLSLGCKSVEEVRIGLAIQDKLKEKNS
jgi:hypothetical protein